MSQENVQIVRRTCEAFDAGDYEAALDVFAPDVAYDLSHFPDGGVYRGRGGVREAFRIWLGTWEDYRQERDEFVDAGDQVVVAVREYGRGKGKRPGARTSNLWGLDAARLQGCPDPLLPDDGRRP